MDYSLLTLVDDKDEAMRFSDYLNLNNVDSCAAQADEYDSGQWGVYIDGSQAEIAQSLLDSYNVIDNYAYSNSHAIYPSRRYSLGGSSHSWGYYLLLFLVVGGVRLCLQMNKNDNNRQREIVVDEILERNRKTLEMNRKAAEIVQERMDNGTLFNTPKSQNNITINDIKKIVERNNQHLSKFTNESIKNGSISMKGSKIYLDITLKEGYVMLKDVEETKKEEAKYLLDFINSYKFRYGDDILDQFAKLGITFNFRLYYDGVKTPVKTMTIPISYIKKVDKS